MMTLNELYEQGVRVLNEAGVEESDLDAWYLLSHLTGLTRVQFMLNKGQVTEQNVIDRFNECIGERAKRIPLQYIIGSQEFMGLPFTVNENVLIPRQDTEVLVEEVLKVSEGKSVLDICTGSGCIIVSIAKLSKVTKAVGIDISKGALEVAKANANKNQVDVQFIESDLFQNVTGKFDVIVSNPPYIESHVIPTLMPEVRCHEPMLALDGMEDGLYFYDKIIKESRHYLKENGSIYFERGYNLGEDVKQMLINAGFQNVVVIKDLAGLDRVVCGSLEESI